MNLTSRAQTIIEWCKGYGIQVVRDSEDHKLHVISIGSRQGTWIERDAFKKIDAFNARIDAHNWQDKE